MTPRVQVVRKWRSLAWRLGLSDCILDIDCYRGGSVSGMSRRRRGSREKDKLELLIKIWRESRPETFNVGVLKTILSAEVLIFNSISKLFQHLPTGIVRHVDVDQHHHQQVRCPAGPVSPVPRQPCQDWSHPVEQVSVQRPVQLLPVFLR